MGIGNRSRNLLSCSPSPPRIKNPFFCKMGNVQGQHGDPTRKHSEAGHGLVFNGDKHQREMSPFDPIGPVAITTRTEVQSPASRAPHRPRSTTESGPRRHVTIDYGNDQNAKIDEESSIIKNNNNNDSSSSSSSSNTNNGDNNNNDKQETTNNK